MEATVVRWIYEFGGPSRPAKPHAAQLLGLKGANLAEMTSLGVPVPPGFTITTQACSFYHTHDRQFPIDLKEQVEAGLAEVGRLSGKVFGDPRNPLLVSIRAGAPEFMPGLMDGILNLGLNDVAVEAVAAGAANERFAHDTYRRFIHMYSNLVLGLDNHSFEENLDNYKDRKGRSLDIELDAFDWRHVIGEYKQKVLDDTCEPFPQDPYEQLWSAIGAAFSSWMRYHLSPPPLHPRDLGHSGQRASHGVRQYGRHLGDWRCLHPRPLQR
jgi:pyruvate, orthophosphate dikinase